MNVSATTDYIKNSANWVIYGSSNQQVVNSHLSLTNLILKITLKRTCNPIQAKRNYYPV